MSLLSFTLLSLFLGLSHVNGADDALLVTSKAFFDVSIDGVAAGKIVVGLFGKTVPKTVANFEALVGGTYKGGNYKGTTFHRVIPDFMLQGGDFSSPPDRIGAGSESIYGKYFADENFTLSHYGAGWLSMANAGKDTNGSQFFITFKATPWLNNKHTVFAKVLEGMKIIRRIEKLKTINDKPTQEVLVTDCGVIAVAVPFSVPATTAAENV